MGLRDTVEFAHLALRLVPEVLDAVDVVLLVCKEFGVIDPEVMKTGNNPHDLAAKHGLVLSLQFMGDDLTQTMKIESRRLPVHTTQTRRCSRQRPSNKMFNQTTLFITAQTVLAHGSHDNPNSWLSGTAPYFFSTSLSVRRRCSSIT